MMLMLGANVTSVEPQPDLAHAIVETARLNCWSARSVVHNAKACAATSKLHPAVRGRECMQPTPTGETMAWRMGTGPSALQFKWETAERFGSDWPRHAGLPESVRGMNLTQLLLESASAVSVAGSVAQGKAGEEEEVEDKSGDNTKDPSSSSKKPPPPLQLSIVKMDGDGPEVL